MVFRIFSPRVTVAFMVFVSVCFIFISVISVLSQGPWYIILFNTTWSVSISVYLSYVCLIRRVAIMENGVEYRTLFRKELVLWDDIEFIGIGYYPHRGAGLPTWVYFVDQLPTDRFPCVSDAFLKMHYRKAIVTEIQKYWDGEIFGLLFVDENNK